MNAHRRAVILLLLLILLPLSPAVAHAAPVDEAPTMLSPADGATTTGATDPPIGVPTLRWEAVASATRYHVQVSVSAGFSSTMVDKDTAALSYTHDVALADGIYYWRVKALVANVWGPYSDAWSFSKDWSSGGALAPLLQSPAEGASLAAFKDPDFSWSPLVGAATYRFEISQEPGFGGTVYAATTLGPRHTPTLRLSKNLYYWRVVPFDRRGNAGVPSAVRSFHFDWNLAPSLLAPDANLDAPFLPRFQWTAVEAAKLCRLEISTQPDFSTSVNAYTTDQTDYTPERTLANDQDFYWRVRAVDARDFNGPWSEVRRFRMKWTFPPQLLTPANNDILVGHPYFSWQPVPGAERYQIVIDDSLSFLEPIADITLYNGTAWAQPEWRTVIFNSDYFWRVRALDTENNTGPWSATRSFRLSLAAAPNPVYPPYYYAPDSANTPVFSDRTIAWPAFSWQGTHTYADINAAAVPSTHYRVEADDDPSFASPNFQAETAGLSAAPTAAQPFTGLAPGQLYHWRVTSFGAQGPRTSSSWVFRYDPAAPELPFATVPTLIAPSDRFDASGFPPMLSWQPVQGATSYLLQLARDAAFSDIVEAPLPQVPYYGPGQGSATALPSGIYWWRTRVETPAPGAWSEARRFHLAADLANGNPYDFVPPTESLLQVKPGYAPVSTIVSESPAEPGLGGLDLGPLHAILDRTIDKTGLNYHWVFAFGTTAGEPSDLTYTLLIDMDHLAGSGAPAHPEGLPLQIDPLFYPEYALVIPKAAGAAMAGLPVRFYEWGGAGWGVPQPLASIGGQLGYEATTRSLQVLLPYSSIGPEDPDHSGAAALFLVTSPPGSPIADSVPEQPGAILNRPVLVTDMLLPLFPFDTPLSNPRILRDPPAPRWALPWFDSVDGYQVQVARDAAFTKLVETWETYESGTWKYFEVAPATFASKLACEDNESYYWRVRIRHERYTASQTTYDYGRWSPGLRFKLESRFPGTPLPAHGAVVYNTPTFTWQRVEGAAGYRLQVDNDANFTSPVFDVKPDGASYTPPGGLPDGTYYWRLAIRRADTVYGSWTAARSFTKASQAPALLAPSPDQVLSGQPAFSWSPVLTPTLAPRAAAPRYRLQFAADPNFTVPKTTDTDSTSYSPVKGQALDDGTWYVRVAVIDAWNRAGSYGAARRFYKEYPAPTLLSPLQGSSVPGAPSFEWAPLSGAAYYRIQIANNELFNGATTATTDATRFTPLTALSFGSYYWRVQMVDADGKPGPYRTGRVAVGFRGYLPVASKMR